MKYEIALNGRFIADINYWTGKTKLSYEGMELTEEGKNTFLLGSEKCIIAGTLFAGVYLCRGDEKVLIAKLSWGDYVAGIIPFLVSLIGGAIGAVLGAICFFVCYKIMPYIKSYIVRLIICLAIASAVFFLILLLAAIFPGLFGIKTE